MLPACSLFVRVAFLMEPSRMRSSFAAVVVRLWFMKSPWTPLTFEYPTGNLDDTLCPRTWVGWNTEKGQTWYAEDNIVCIPCPFLRARIYQGLPLVAKRVPPNSEVDMTRYPRFALLYISGPERAAAMILWTKHM